MSGQVSVRQVSAGVRQVSGRCQSSTFILTETGHKRVGPEHVNILSAAPRPLCPLAAPGQAGGKNNARTPRRDEIGGKKRDVAASRQSAANQIIAANVCGGLPTRRYAGNQTDSLYREPGEQPRKLLGFAYFARVCGLSVLHNLSCHPEIRGQIRSFFHPGTGPGAAGPRI